MSAAGLAAHPAAGTEGPPERLVGDGRLRRGRGHPRRDDRRQLLLPRGSTPPYGRPHGTPEPAVVAPAVLTAALLASLVPVRRRGPGSTARPAERARSRCSRRATCIQAAYLGVQLHLFVTTSRGSRPRRAPTRRSTTSCSAPRTHTSWSGCSSISWLLVRLALAPHPVPARRARVGRPLLVRRRRDDRRRPRARSSRRRL